MAPAGCEPTSASRIRRSREHSVELPHVEHLGKSRFRIGDLLSRSIARSRAMNIDLAMNTDLAGIRIPDSKLAREIMELVRDTESPAVSPLEPRLLLGRPRRQASRTEIRSRTALCRRDVPRHGLDASAQHHAGTLRG